jgi:hypothetical protein
VIDRRYVVDVPPGALVTKDRRVLWTTAKVYDAKRKFNRDKRRLIGKSLEASTTRMYPNDNFKELFPDDYQTLLKRRPAPSSQSIGMYMATMEIAERLPLYKTLYDVFGKEDTDQILDYAMYQIISESAVSQHYEATLKDKALFSECLQSDSYLSAFFRENIDEDKISLFLELWAPKIIDFKKIKETYMNVDGSNIDCEAEGVTIKEEGHDKSGEGTTIVGIMYVVSPDGTPIYYIQYRGSIIDSVAVKAVHLFFKHLKAEIAGFFADRGFCTKEGTDLLREMKVGFVLMMTSKPEGFTTARNEMREAIRNNIDKWIEGSELFGDKAKCRMFKNDTVDSYLHVYYDSAKAGKAIKTLLRKINRAKASALKAIKNKKDPKIPDDVKEFIHLRKSRGPRTLITEYDKIQEAINDKGMHIIATSEDMDTLEAYRIYHARDSSETQYMFMKSEIGLEKYYTGSDESITGKQFVAFIAGIIRNELNLASRNMLAEIDRRDWYSVPAIIKELVDIKMRRLPGDEYALVMNSSSRDNFMLKHLGLSKEKVDDYVKKQNLRIKGYSR